MGASFHNFEKHENWAPTAPIISRPLKIVTRLQSGSSLDPWMKIFSKIYWNLYGILIIIVNLKILNVLYCWSWSGPLLGFQNFGCIFAKKTEDKRHFCTKIKGIKSDFRKICGCRPAFLKICGCNCTHCTHTNQEPAPWAWAAWKNFSLMTIWKVVTHLKFLVPKYLSGGEFLRHVVAGGSRNCERTHRKMKVLNLWEL